MICLGIQSDCSSLSWTLFHCHYQVWHLAHFLQQGKSTSSSSSMERISWVFCLVFSKQYFHFQGTFLCDTNGIMLQWRQNLLFRSQDNLGINGCSLMDVHYPTLLRLDRANNSQFCPETHIRLQLLLSRIKGVLYSSIFFQLVKKKNGKRMSTEEVTAMLLVLSNETSIWECFTSWIHLWWDQ